jgi:hypothetical protein
MHFQKKIFHLLLVLFCLPLFAQNNPNKEKNAIADIPLFRDSIYDGAAVPTIVWKANRKNGSCFIPTAEAEHPKIKESTITKPEGVPFR